MLAAPSRQGAPLVVVRPDRASFLVAAPDAVLEVDGLGSSPALLGRLPCGGRVAQLGVSVSTETGQAVLAAALESGLVELWDLDRGGGAGALLDVVHLPGREKALKAAAAKDGQPHRCLLAGAPSAEPLFFLSVSVVAPAGSGATAPTIHVLSASADGASTQTQRLDAVDASRKKAPAVDLACHASRPLLSVCFADGVLHLYDTSRIQQDAGGSAEEGAGGARLPVQEQGEQEGDDEEAEAASTAGDEEDGEGDAANPSVKLTKAQRQLLLVPLAALRFGAGLQGVPSCLAFSPGPDFLLAGTTGGQLAVWSFSRALHAVSPPQTHKRSGSSMTLAKLMREDNAAPPLFSCDIPARASTGGVAVAAAAFVGGAGPFVLAVVRDAAARSRRSSASRLRERRRSRAGGFGVDDEEEEEDGDDTAGNTAGKEQDEPVQYKAARVVVLAISPDALAVMGTSQPVAEPVRMVLSSGHQGRLLVAGGAAGTAAPPMRLVSLADVVGLPTLGPVPAALSPGTPASWSAFVGPKGGWPPALTALSLQHRLQVSLPGGSSSKVGEGPALAVKTMLMAQPLHTLQKDRSAPSTAAASAGVGAWGFLLPATLGELRACLPSARPQLQQLQQLGPSTLLWPHRLEVRAGLGLLTCRVVSPLEQPFALLPQQQPQQAPEQDGCAGFPTVVLLVRCASASGDNAPSQSPLLYAAAGRDAAFTSDTTVAVLSPDGGQVSEVRLAGAEWAAGPILTGVEPPAYRVFPAAEQSGLLLAQGTGSSATRLAIARAAEEGAAAGWDGQVLQAVDLYEGESVKEAAWQVGLLGHGGGTPTTPAASVLGLLTSQRVLLLAQDLTMLAATPLASSPPVHHLLWLGPALLLASAGGPVSYLDIDGRSGTPSLRPLSALDHRHAGARLLAALPDRLVYAARTGASNVSQVLSRPLLPLEPLVVGALALLPRMLQGTGHAASGDEVRTRVASVIEAVVSRYGPRWLEQASGPVYAAGEGPGANAGVTGAVCVSLARAGFADLAAGLAGVATQGSARSVAGGGGQEQGAYPRRPWIPSAVKAGLAAGPSGQQWMAALAEALADDPAAREYALSPTSLSSAALPLRHRGLSHVLAALGESARRSGHAEAALRLLDVAGEDEAVVSLLLLHLLGQGAGPVSHDRAGLLRELFALKADPHVLALAEALWPDWRDVDAAGSSTSEAVTAALVGEKLASQAFPTAVQRRPALLPPLPVDRELPSWRQQAIARNGVSAAAGSGGTPGTGPMRAAGLRRLLLDRVEEWLGRGTPEGLSDEEDGEGRGEDGAGAVVAAGAGEGDAGTTATWVKGVGQGREDEDNVVLYYRFGEMAPLGPVSTAAESGPQMHSFQGDISPYGHAVEVDAAAVGFESSTCPMDPGDEGKVRQAMDAVWRGTGGGPGAGLRFRVPRGSALDVGPYHASGPRSKLTVELWIQRPEGAGAGYDVLLCRRTSEDAGPSTALWSLGIAADGALALWTGDDPVAGEGTSTLHRTAAGMVPEGRWAHVAFTLETKGKGSVEGGLFVGGKPAAAAPAQLRLPTLPEARLRNTVLEVGPGLAAGSRLTELRVWALLRHADDLYDNRESYLKAAEKRKRLAFKIKGGAAAAGGAATGPAGEEAAASSGAGAGAGAGLLCQPALPAPATGGIGMAPPPPPPAVARRRGLTPPPGAPAPAAKTGEGLQAPPALLPGPSLRRPPSAWRASPTQNTEATAPAPVAETAPASSTIPPSPSSSSATPPPPPAVTGGWASDFESWEGAAASVPAAAPSPAPPKATTAELLVRPADLHVDPAHVLRDPMLAPAFSPQGYFLCFRERSPATAPQSAIVVLALAGPGAPRKMRYPFQSDSAIMVEGEGKAEAAEAAPLIACATSGAAEGGGGGALSVYDLAQRKGVARQPASTQIVHWRWLAPRQLALVTARAVFNWTLPTTGASPPSKLFERRDGAGRRVRAYHQAEGWSLLLSEDAEQEGGVVAQLFHQERARLYLESGGSLVGAGIGRCGCAESPLSLSVVRRDPAGANMRLELYDLADAATAAEGEVADSGGSTPASLLAGRPKLAEVTLPAPAVGTPPVWVFFPKAGAGAGGGESAAIHVLFGGGGQGGLLASWRPPSGRGAGGEATVSHPLVPDPGAALSDACLDARGEHLLVLQQGDLSVWRVPLR